MKILVLWANPSQPNFGVRALARGTEALLRRSWPSADVRFRGAGPSGDGPISISHTSPLLAERLVDRKGLMDWLKSFELIVDTRGGDSFTDIYGFRRLAKMSVISEFARQARVPVVLGPQTIGPFGHWGSRVLARAVLSSASGIIARDSASAEASRRLGREVDLVSTDVVFALPRPTCSITRDVILNVSGLLWDENPHVPYLEYRGAVRALLGRLESEGRSVALLSHVRGVSPSARGDSDDFAVRELDQSLRGSRELLLPDSLEAARQLLGSARLVLASRMHACLNAMSMHVPAVPMAYSRKFAPLFNDLGWEATIDLKSDNVVESAFARAMDPDLPLLASRALDSADQRLVAADRLLKKWLS